LPDHRQVLAACAFHGAEWNPRIEGRQAPAVLHGQREQIDVRHLLMAAAIGRVDERRIPKRHVVAPEMMLAVIAEARQQLDDARGAAANAVL
jgi:hypothetical protein